MIMRSLFFIILTFALVSNPILAQKTHRIDATKTNSYGLTYSLPITAVEVTVEYEITTTTAGPYHHFAKRLLNISDAITDNEVECQLTNIKAKMIGVPDKDNTFLVEFSPNSASSFITLTQDGLMCAINSTYTFSENKNNTESNNENVSESPSVTEGNKYLTEEILRAGTTAKQAELTAKQIYTLRENRNDILSGDVENIPTDAMAFKLLMTKIDEQEKALMTMFSGAKKTEKVSRTVLVDIKSRNTSNRVIARFSKHLGLVKSDNLAGEPIYFSLEATTPAPEALDDPKAIVAFEKKMSRGIVYNIPGKGALEIKFRNKLYVDRNVDVVQFGSQDVLDQKVFGSKHGSLRVVFYPELGAIKSTEIVE